MNPDRNMQIIVMLLSELASTILPVRRLLVVPTRRERFYELESMSVVSFIVHHQVKLYGFT